MHLLLLPMIFTISMSSFVSAQTEQLGPGFDASPLQKAKLAFYGIFTIACLCQLGIAVVFLFRVRSPHLAPAVGAAATLIVTVLANGVNIAATITRNTYDVFQHKAFSDKSILEFQAAGAFLMDSSDSMILLLVALILRDRYLTHCHWGPRHIRSRAFLITPCIVLSILALLILASMSASIYNAEYGLLLDGSISMEVFNKFYGLVTRLHQAFMALYVIFAFILLTCGVVLRMDVPWDRITILTTSIILPLLCLHAISRVIFEVLDDTLSHKSSFTLQTSDELDFSNTVVFYILFFSITGVISYLFLNTRCWGTPTQQPAPSSHNAYSLDFHQTTRPRSVSSLPGLQGAIAEPQNIIGQRQL